MQLVRRVLLCLAAVHISLLSAQQPWTVKQQWVKAHEDFLASDAMQGRGSATHDEEVTATYVASEFEGYGLKFAPGMTGYIQSAEMVAPQLDGHSTLTVAGVKLFEGKDFDLLVSSGTAASGSLRAITSAEVASAKFDRGSAVLVTGTKDSDEASQALSALRRKGASVVILVGGPGTENLFGMLGGKTRTPIHLAEQPGRNGGPTVLLLHADAAAKLKTGDGAPVSVDVQEVTGASQRKTFNAIGYLQGSDPKAGTILLSAHLDHLGIGKPVNGDGLYNGANDDAAGTTAVMELAHALAAGPQPRRSILFVCYGSEEIGGMGSTYFGEHPPIPLTDLVTNLEFEMIGNQDPKMPKGVLLLTGWERSNLGPTLREHGALLGPDPYPEQRFFERSDNYSLALKGVVAHTAAGWGTPPTYHQPNDDIEHLDIPFMTTAIQSLVEPVRWLASSDFVPKWNEGGQPKREGR